MTAKPRVLQAVRARPDDCTMAQIAEEVAILAALERGEEVIAADQTMPHDDVVKRARPWQTTMSSGRRGR